MEIWPQYFLPATNTELETIMDEIGFVRFWAEFKYMALGRYRMNFTAVNRVSKASALYTVAVTKGPCAKPLIEVAKQNPCFTQEMCRNKNERVIS